MKILFRACIEALREKKVRVVLSVGNRFDIAKLGAIPENFIVNNHVPQISVLKQASLFITHRGMNSVSEAMIHGVPMLVIPFVSDQPVNARQVEKLGLGRVMDYRAITADSLKKTALAVMENEHIRDNLVKIREQITRTPGNAGAVRIIETYSQR